jgi:hypothetical protein
MESAALGKEIPMEETEAMGTFGALLFSVFSVQVLVYVL